ncbi:hypothetical protein M1105_20025 [Limibaculum sp. FT325]|uniref:hypothetical protein n=1 Tax=Thermohalobaculum sediminis TaxID=2939436 RepID=UPI0020BE8F74|nr:hypothetical protein [Limibaculum sediminis]MCL5779252.1 hypothetical protein [Limibaculum sediminis]
MAAVLPSLAACVDTLGPQIIRASQVDYNKSVQEVVSEELLLNIVRRRYLEPPQFVTIGSITTQVSNSGSVSVGASGEFPGGGAPNVATASGNAGYTFSDTPTISIMPRADEEVTTQLTQRIFYDTPALLANVGYPPDIIFAVTVAAMGNVQGPEFGIGRNFRPGSPEFVEMIRLVGDLYNRGKLRYGSVMINDPYSDITYTKRDITPEIQMTAVGLGTGKGRFRSFDGGKTYYFTDQNYYTGLWIDEDARDTPEGRRLLQLLNLTRSPLYRFWKVENKKVPTGADFSSLQSTDPQREYLSLLPHSFYSVLNFLAFFVEVPEEHEREGRAFSTDPYDQAIRQGTAVDLYPFLTIRSSRERPADAYVAIRHRDTWFYIDDRDQDSKRFFNAVYDLFNLVIAPSGGSAGPVLTLPLQ